ncbi:hypothetical protein BV898_12933 [Hypsibius exemplaris]|uniref:BEN domain-containing protein n=1 Tax=Hypsibius exemplaris TaxID=2072580 RepID=A0A1W0WC71_HYPEX|nr:hypothetical protein BV898_12933 [Hypsibius exemplaris]
MRRVCLFFARTDFWIDTSTSSDKSKLRTASAENNMSIPSPFRRMARTNGHDVSRSAIVFWHEARGCPQTVRALPLSDIEPAMTGARVSEKTVCSARYRGERFPCIVLWIEDKTPDELVVSRLLPATNMKIFEEKGHRWAEELGVSQNDLGEFAEGGAFMEEPRYPRYRYDPQRNGEREDNRSVSDDKRAEFPSPSFSVVDPEAPAEPHIVYPVLHGSSSITSTSTCGSSNEMSSNAAMASRVGGTSVICQPRKQALPRKINLDQHHEDAQDDSDDESREAALREPKEEEFEPEDADMVMLDKRSEDGSAGSELIQRSAPAPIGNLASVPTDPILKKMVLETSWTKALRVAMMDLFSTEELATSLPHQPKAGMRVLDQFRLSIVKDLLNDWCVARNAAVPSRRHLCQAIHNCLISCRTSKYKLKKYGGEGNIPGKPSRSMDFPDQRRSLKKF